MRCLVIVKANKDSEAGVMPSQKLLEDMGKFNEELAKAGVMLAAEGLHPSSKGKRVKFSGGKTTVTDGPFTETKELIAGFWLWQVRSMDEAIEWLKRSPFDGGAEIEIRPSSKPTTSVPNSPPNSASKKTASASKSKRSQKPRDPIRGARYESGEYETTRV